MIDLAILRVVKYREQYEKVHRYIPNSAIDKRTRSIVKDIGKYFNLHEEAEVLDFPTFRSLFFTSWHKNLKKEDCDYYNRVLDRMVDDVPESNKKSLINQLLELEYATDVANAVQDYEAGEEIDLVVVIDNMTTKVKNNMERSNACEFADIDDTTIGVESEENGLKWCLKQLNETYRPIQGGDQYIVSARPGRGKTTFLTHNNHSMAQDMPLNKIIVWFNNESRRQRIMARQIHSALGVTEQEAAALKADGKLTERYIEEMGRKDRVRVYDVHGKNNFFLEEILEGIGIDNVGAIVFDMLDNVRFPMRTDAREDQRLEQLYQWARELGVKYNCPTFPTSQVSNEGAGLLFPTESMLKDSKTGKQGACDGVIMIGCDDDPLNENVRGISMPKTKSKRAGASDLRAEVLLDADKGRYIG